MRKDNYEKGILVLSSSCTQPGNPSSMRSFGIPRNVVYNFKGYSDRSYLPGTEKKETDKDSFRSVPSYASAKKP